jgi:tRNA threonylcarbamoyladenosine biosynthesis protein TsaE
LGHRKGELEYITNSDEETVGFGQELGKLLGEGDLVALTGELGSGKTWFSKGIALGLGVDRGIVVTSPSFALVNEYQGRHVFYHMDLYRLEGPGDLITSGLEEYLHMGGVVVIEWADRLPDIIPEWGLEVKFKILDERRRHLTFHGHHPRTLEILKALGKTQHTAP